MRPREVTEGGERHRQRWVQMSAGDVPDGHYNHHHCQPCACRVPAESLDAGVFKVHDWSGRRREYQNERPDELCSHLRLITWKALIYCNYIQLYKI